MTTALLLLDLQEAMCRTDGTMGSGGLADEIARRGVLDRATAVLKAQRARNGHVLHVRVAFDDNYSRMTSASPRFATLREKRLMLDSNPESRICAEVEPGPGEPVVTKGCVNPFIGTILTQLLTLRRVTHLMLGGVATTHVVEATARFAADSGYRVTVLEDVCAAASDEMHRFSVEKVLPNYADISSSADFVRGVG